jgi:hypothetical protein
MRRLPMKSDLPYSTHLTHPTHPTIWSDHSPCRRPIRVAHYPRLESLCVAF